MPKNQLDFLSKMPIDKLDKKSYNIYRLDDSSSLHNQGRSPDTRENQPTPRQITSWRLYNAKVPDLQGITGGIRNESAFNRP